MPATPVDDHTHEYEQLAGLSALRVLEGDDLERFEQHAAACERCQLMVRLDREVLARVSLAVPGMDPSPDFKARLMRRAAEELQQTPPSTQAQPRAQAELHTRNEPQTQNEPIRLHPRAAPPAGLPLWRRSPYLSALAAVLVLGLVTAGAFTYQNQSVAVYALSGDGPGKATVVIRRSGAAELEMHGVPDPEPGFVYEAWVIPPGKQPVAAGTSATGEANVPLPGDVRGATVAITRERGRVDAPTSAPLMATVVQS